MEPAIRVENLGKLYRVTSRGERPAYATLRETLMHAAGSPLRWARQGFAKPDPAEDFWALKDVNFEVMPGEVVGIIGRNGAGKSTLLKILSRITKPTTGRVTLNGRVGSLLEVGTGFHPELTGRENVYLNGSILGMSRREIAKKFDEIVAFAEVERFLDTPVKRYSSGMYVRLAFAVAAHLEPEILIVDEVLAVGDAVFQRKCLSLMTNLAQSGMTILFVSHTMEILPRLCSKALWLANGQIHREGFAHEVINDYLADYKSQDLTLKIVDKHRTGTGSAKFRSLSLEDDNGRQIATIPSDESFKLVAILDVYSPLKSVNVGIVLRTLQGTRALSALTDEVGQHVDLNSGSYRIELSFDSPRIRSGRQLIAELWLHSGEVIDYLPDAAVYEVMERSASQFTPTGDQGLILCDYQFNIKPVNCPASQLVSAE